MLNRWLLFFFLLITPLPAHEGLKIHVIGFRNGVGLSQDIDLLMEELRKLGHETEFVHIHDRTLRPQADINVFVDISDEALFPLARKNYLIPNPEWCLLSPKEIARFDKILCKTKEAVRIFQPLNPKTELISFSCRDCYDPSISKNYQHPLHLAGASIQKGTEMVARAWTENPQFPQLLLIRHKGNALYPPAANLKLVYDYLSDEKLNIIRNRCGMHLCPSETEGFGHYLFEALCCGNVVVTTDAPPMNEFITDPRCLVTTCRSEKWRLAERYFIHPASLDRVVATLLSLSNEELEEIGKRNRIFYLENDRFFKKRLAEVFSTLP